MNTIKGFLQEKKELALVEDREKVAKRLPLRVMDRPELSLGPSSSTFSESANSSSSESEAIPCRKRKHTWDEPTTQTSIELQLSDPLPLDWEQCLDLQSGRMYYLNRKSLKKSWVRPKEQKLNLELNISTLPSSQGKEASSTTFDHYSKKYTMNSSGNMVAVACLNCHLLVMLCKSSPSCPNCKYVHSLLLTQPQKIEAVKSLETLSLLH